MIKNTLVPFVHTLILASAIVAGSCVLERTVISQGAAERERDLVIEGQLVALTGVVAELAAKPTTVPIYSTVVGPRRRCFSTNSGCYDEEAAIAAQCKNDVSCIMGAWRRTWGWAPPWSPEWNRAFVPLNANP